MGVGALYKQLRGMEGAYVTLRCGHKNKALTGTVESVNLHKEGLYVMLKLPNGQNKLLTPEDKVHDVTYQPQPVNENPESLGGGSGPY